MQYKFSDITGKIIGCAMSVHKALGNGFQSYNYTDLHSFYVSANIKTNKDNRSFFTGKNYFLVIVGKNKNNDYKVLEFICAPMDIIFSKGLQFNEHEEQYYLHRQIEDSKGFILDGNDNTIEINQYTKGDEATVGHNTKQNPLPKRQTFSEFSNSISISQSTATSTSGSTNSEFSNSVSISPMGTGSPSIGYDAHFDYLTHVVPANISVYLHSSGQIVSVPWATYVKNVLPNEWGNSCPTEDLKAGAVMVKQYVWQRHYSTKNANFDVWDNVYDQTYIPNTETTTCDNAINGVANTVTATNEKGSQNSYTIGYVTYYTSGTGYYTTQGEYGGHAYQDGMAYLANNGYTWFQIMQYYYSNYSGGGAGTTNGSTGQIYKYSY